MKVIGYIRVSTEEQTADGTSLPTQREKIEQYAKLYGLELVEVIEDAGESARTLNRPGVQRALKLLRTGKAAGLVIAKLDRLTRSVSDWQHLIENYFGEKPGKQLFSVADSIDTRTAGGRLVLNVLLSVAQWERETIGERTRDALRFKATKYERISRHCPYGFDFLPDNRLAPNPSEQKTIAEIVAMRASGSTLQNIADSLTARGVKTKNGGAWHKTVVGKILDRQKRLTVPAA